MTPSQNNSSEASHQSIMMIVLIVVIMVSISGLFMGMRQNDNEDSWRSSWKAGPQADKSEQKEYPVAPQYKDIPTAKWKANKNWNNSFSNLPHQKISLKPQKPLSVAERKKIIAERATRRAYDGAPPTIPHAINYRDVYSCTACHAKDATVIIAGRRPSVMSHPMMANCTQCHVPADGLKVLQHSGTVGLVVASKFKGAKNPGMGTRAYKNAPPTIPHKVSMRQNCASCHGVGMPNALVTSHPMRANCLQCHAPEANYDNREMLAEPLAPWEK